MKVRILTSFVSYLFIYSMSSIFNLVMHPLTQNYYQNTENDINSKEIRCVSRPSEFPQPIWNLTRLQTETFRLFHNVCIIEHIMFDVFIFWHTCRFFFFHLDLRIFFVAAIKLFSSQEFIIKNIFSSPCSQLAQRKRIFDKGHFPQVYKKLFF